MRFVTLFLSFFSIIATVLPLINSPAWWIRIFDFPRAQIAVFCVVSIVLCIFYLPRKQAYKVILMTSLAVCVLFQLQKIIKYTPLYPVQAKDGIITDDKSHFSLLISNVQMSNEDKGKLIALVNNVQPDILLINEPDEAWAQALAIFDQEYPYSFKKPLPNTYGMMFYSKFPLSGGGIKFLVSEDVPSVHTTITLPSGQEFRFYGLHPKPPQPGTDTYQRDTEILIVGREIKENDFPVIVAGDLNDVAWSHTSELFQEYAQLVDPREGRGLFNTYNVNIPLFRYPLDHIFYSKEFGLIKIEKLEDIGSDHFPMYIELSFEPSTDHSQNLQERDQETNEEASEKIEEGKEKGNY